MANSFYKNKMNIRGGGIVKLLIVAILLFTTSCNNLIQVQDKHGSLSIAVPGGRATADNLSYTVSITNRAGSSQTKTVPSGQTVTFEELTPGTYTIAVEGKVPVEETTTTTTTEKVVYYGTSTATVTAGASASATVNLGPVVSTFEDLKKAVIEGGTVAVYGEITVEETLPISEAVTILSAKEQSTLLHAASLTDSIFLVSGGNLTLGDEKNFVFLDGRNASANAITVNGGGSVAQMGMVSIYGYNESAVSVSGGTYTLDGGGILNNSADLGGGVHISDAGEFIMKRGSITKNKASNGGGVYMDGGTFTYTDGIIAGNSFLDDAGDGAGVCVSGGTFTMSENASIAEDNDVYLGTGNTITVGGKLHKNYVATITLSADGYTSGTTVLSNVPGDNNNPMATEYSKFKISPDSFDTQYAVGSEGTLGYLATDEASLQSAVYSLEYAADPGGTIYIANDIEFMNGPISVSTEIELVALKDVRLTSKSGALFNFPRPQQSSTQTGKLVIGRGHHSITLDGKRNEGQAILAENDGIVDFYENAVITNFTDRAVYLASGGTFNMYGGKIEGNTGHGVYLNSSGVLRMNGDSVISSDNDVYLGGGTISVESPLTGGTTVATINPGDYPTADTQVLTGSSVSTEYTKFAVTTHADGTEWIIDAEGKLQKKQ